MTKLEQMKEEFWEKHIKPKYSPFDDAIAFIAEEKRKCFADLDALIEEAIKESIDPYIPMKPKKSYKVTLTPDAPKEEE